MKTLPLRPTAVTEGDRAAPEAHLLTLHEVTHAEFLRLEEACRQDWQKLAIRIFVHTGLRHQELCQLPQSAIDFTRREIRLKGEWTKGGKPRAVPLFPDLSRTVENWCLENPGPYLFSHGIPPVPYTSFQGFFRLACKRVGLEDLRIHDLRHTFASWWMQEGGDIYVLKSILGHATLQMVERYAHLDTGAAQRAVEEFPTHSFGTLGA